MADKVKLVLAILILAVGIGGYYYLGDKPLLLRLVPILASVAMAIAVAAFTAQGRAAWEFTKGARTELRKVVWPSRRETLQMTAVVFVLVLLVALFLWGVDWVLHYVVTTVTKRGA
jgi:preprotein translocase subunit SecE